MFIPLTAKTIVPYTPPALAAAARVAHKEPPRFMIGVPTLGARDQLTARLMAMGLNPVSEQLIRMTIIDELWTVYKPDEAEKYATELDGVWQREAVQQNAIAIWSEQEEQRLLDTQAGAPERPPAELPQRIISVRDEARATLVVDNVIKSSQRVRDLLAERIDYQRRNAVMLVRMHVAGVEGLDLLHPLELERDALTEESAAQVRELLSDEAWHELVQHIDRLYVLDEREEKNFDSPLGSLSDPSGLPEPTDDLANSDGNSTTSNIIPLPIAVSETTTAPSSPSIIAPDVPIPSSGPTDAA